MKKMLLLGSLLLLGIGCGRVSEITSFEECVKAGNAVMESYPRQCIAGGKTFAERVPEAPRPEVQLPMNAELGETFTLQPGQFRGVDGGIRLTLLEINDSRCPADVQCIWAGELSAHLKLEGPEETAPPQEFFLGTVRGRTAEASGFTFTLKDVSESLVTLVVTR